MTTQAEYTKHIASFSNWFKTSNVSDAHTDQTNLPALVIPKILQSLPLNVKQYRNIHGAIIRVWDEVETNEEQDMALISIMFGNK